MESALGDFQPELYSQFTRHDNRSMRVCLVAEPRGHNHKPVFFPSAWPFCNPLSFAGVRHPTIF